MGKQSITKICGGEGGGGGGGWHKAIKMEISQMKPSARWLSWRTEVVMKFFYD